MWDQKRLRQGVNKMGLWKHGAEQMLAEAGMQNQERAVSYTHLTLPTICSV